MKKKVNYLKFTTNNTNHHEQQGNIITRVRGVCLVRGLFSLLCATAIFFTACFNFDERPDGSAAGFVAVTDITGVPTASMPNVGTPLTATVEPHNATEKRIEWTVKTDGGTQSSIDGSRLTANAEGTVTVTARIKDGLGEGEDFTKDFDILISLVVPYKVIDIYDIPAYLPIGEFTYTLHGKITPVNATHRTIEWSVIDDGGTGATVTPEGFLSAARKGTVTLRATIVNGLLEDGDYTKDFKIDITRGVIAAGNYKTNYDYEEKACYWIDGEFNELHNANAVSSASFDYTSRTTGIVEANGKLYIAGHYLSNASTREVTICYWLNGVEKTLPDSAGRHDGGFPGYYTRSYSIAEGGGYVYIYGLVYGTYCYWKIDANNDSAEPVRVTLTMPSTGIFSSDFDRIVVKNDGNVVIVSGLVNYSSYEGHYYWMSSTGNETSLSPVRIDVISNLSDGGIEDIAVVNNDVYMAGWKSNSSVGFYGHDPFYYRLGDSDITVFNALNGRFNESQGGLLSVIVQNGVLVFYGGKFTRYNSRYKFYGYWRIGGDLIDIPMNITDYYFKFGVFSDGDVYMAVNSDIRNMIDAYGIAGYVVLREQSLPFRKLEPSGSYSKERKTIITGMVVINDNMLFGTVGSIAAPNWREGEAVSLAAPSINLYGQAITEQGWEISDDGDEEWTHFTATTASISHNGKYLRYYAKGSSGRMYHSNTVAIRVRSATEREVTIAMWDSYGDDWNGNAAIRINVNGSDLPLDAKKTTSTSNGPVYYTFDVNTGDIVILYWISGSYDYENAFAVYYSDDPPNPMFNPSSGTTDTGRVLVSYQYNSMNSIANGALLGSFTMP